MAKQPPTQKSKELVVLKPLAKEKIQAIVKIVDEFGMANVEEKGITKAFQVTQGVQAIRLALTEEVMAHFMPLMDTPLGFLTDGPSQTPPKKYPVDMVRDCLVDVLLKGGYPTGNEFNIIAKRAYFTKAFFDRKVREFPGLTDLNITWGLPRTDPEDVKRAFVDAHATWKVDGVGMSIVLRGDNAIPIRVNNKMGDDGILGKAQRKIKARIYERLTGSEMSLTPEGEVGDTIPADVVAVDGKPVDKAGGFLGTAKKQKEESTEKNPDSDTSDSSVPPAEPLTLEPETKKKPLVQEPKAPPTSSKKAPAKGNLTLEINALKRDVIKALKAKGAKEPGSMLDGTIKSLCKQMIEKDAPTTIAEAQKCRENLASFIEENFG